MPHRLRQMYLISLLLLLLASAVAPVAVAQPAGLPGVRGTLYESPSFGWILIAQQPDWTIVEASSGNGVDAVHLHADAGDGADDYFVSWIDSGEGAAGCARQLVATLTSMFDGRAVQGWHEPDVEFADRGADGQVAYARVVSNEDPQDDVLAYVECTSGDSGLLIGQLLLRTARDFDGDFSPASEEPSWPGQQHTGRARGLNPPDRQDNPGVVRFLARGWPMGESGYPFPFSCIHQESFTRPAESPPPDRGWYACDGQIANVDVVPVTIDLSAIVIGCENLDPGVAPPGCPAEPVAPSHFEVLAGPRGDGGSRITLQPGESVEVVLWYALPGGVPPQELYYVEPDRLVLVGPTFYSAGTGSQIPVIISGQGE
jgi:hypothetical protein